VVEVASGQPLDTFLKDRIFTPLGMNDTYFYLPSGKAPRLATVCNPEEGGGLKRAPEGPGMDTQGQYVSGPRRSFSGGAGLVSSAADYYRFLQMMENGGELDGQRLLSPRTVKLMTVDHLPASAGWNQGTGFGLGFSVVTDMGKNGTYGSEGTYGWGGAYHSTYWVDPAEELIVVYFTQVRPDARVPDHAVLRNLVYQALVD
jgi:CubicO group peptidase (beta-lactamase class C family)